MGLDCTAYKNIQTMNSEEIEYDYYDEDQEYKTPKNGVCFYLNKGFPNSALDIIENATYKYEDTFSWRAGSYSGYGEWRNWLATIAGFQSSKDFWQKANINTPFYQLIYFSDAEGTLGTLTCKKLLEDFIKFENQVNSLHESYNYFKEFYQTWKKALEFASQNGAISFQ